ncbi:ATP-binding protein [Spirochaeta dissipatitropha]
MIKKKLLRHNRSRIIVVLVSVLLVLTVSLLSTWYYNQLRSRLFFQAEETWSVQSERAVQDVYFHILENRQLLFDLARLPAIRGFAGSMPDSREESDFLENPYYLEVQALFREFMQEERVDFLFMGSIHSSGWIGPEWFEVAEDYDAHSRNWFLQPQLRNDFYVSPPYAPTNAPESRVVTMNVPVTRDGSFIGSIGLDMQMDGIFAALRTRAEQSGMRYSLHSTNPRRSDQEYYMLFHSDYTLLEDVRLVDMLRDIGVGNDDHVAELAAALLQPQYSTHSYRGSNSRNRMLVQRSVPETDWILLIDSDISHLENQAAGEALRFLLAGLLIAVLVTLVLAGYLNLQKKNRLLGNTMQEIVDMQHRLLQSSKESALGHVIMGLAHEINTPLGNALMISSIAAEQSTDAEVQILYDSLKKIAAMVTRFKELDVLTNRQAVEYERLSSIVRSEFDLYSLDRQRNTSRFELVLNIMEEPERVRQEFRIILHELIKNSFEHAFDYGARQAGARIRISLERKDNSWMLQYEDNGKPVEHELRESVFEPFVTSGRRDGKIGLGLFLASSIIHNLLNGDIQLLESPGNGTCFLMTWPVEN